MKHNFLLLASVIGMLSFSSCAKDHASELEVGKEVDKEVNQEVKKEVKVSATFNGLISGGVTSRATGTSWATGDAIGLFMKTAGTTLTQPTLAQNVKFTSDGSTTFTSPVDNKIYYPFNKLNVDFISYYPYTEDIKDLNYPIDLAVQTNLAALDLMYSDNVKAVNSGNAGVDLNMTHQLTKVIFKITKNNSGKNLAGLKAKVTNVFTKAPFSLIDGTLGENSVLHDVSLNVNSEGTLFEAILLPDTDLRDNTLVITIGETNYTYPLSSTEVKRFDKSTKCEFDITLQAGQGPILEGVTVTVTDWISVKEDITVTEDPATPSAGESGGVEGGGTDGDETGGEDTPPVVEGDDTPPAIADGDGTEANPYSITQALLIKEAKLRVCIKGYIVGMYTNVGKSYFIPTAEVGLKYYLAAASTINETDGQKTFPINLNGAFSLYLMKAINLQDNPKHFNKAIIIKGDIAEVFKAEGHKAYGLEGSTIAIIDGVTYNPKE